MDTYYIGEILPVAFNYAPEDFYFCAGQLLPISQFQALYGVININFGGNGTTNFNLPDLQGNVPVGAGYAPGLTEVILGDKGGTAMPITLTASNFPAHTHLATVQMKANGTGGTSNVVNPQNNYYSSLSGLNRTYQAAAGAGQNMGAINNAVSSSFGVTTPITLNAQNPYVAFNMCICYSGIFPVRQQ